MRDAATEENVKKSKLWEYERIHFAAHSLAKESKPQFSGIILATAEGSNEDGYLQMYEIFKLRLNARLVVLSGCETGLGQQTKSEGMMGLMRAFMYAGAESIVASLWKIEDRSTSEFMKTFYAGLEKSAPAQALRTAQLDMINGRRYSHPLQEDASLGTRTSCLLVMTLLLLSHIVDATPPSDLYESYNQALIALGQDQTETAIASLKQIIAADPTFWPAYGKLVKAFSALKQAVFAKARAVTVRRWSIMRKAWRFAENWGTDWVKAMS